MNNSCPIMILDLCWNTQSPTSDWPHVIFLEVIQSEGASPPKHTLANSLSSFVLARDNQIVQAAFFQKYSLHFLLTATENRSIVLAATTEPIGLVELATEERFSPALMGKNPQLSISRVVFQVSRRPGLRWQPLSTLQHWNAFKWENN